MKKISRVERKMRRRRFFFRFILLCILATLLCMLALNSEIFAIKNINVVGNNKMEKEDIIKISSINKGENFFKIGTSLGEDLLQKQPYVKSVKIKRKFPNTIIINLVEKKEILQLKKISSYLIIDEEGHILNIVNEKIEGLPYLMGIDINDKDISDNIFENKDNINIDFIKLAYDLDLLSKIQEIDMEDNSNVKILLNDGITIAFGALDNVKYKLKLLNEILVTIEKEEISCKMILMDRGENPIIVPND